MSPMQPPEPLLNQGNSFSVEEVGERPMKVRRSSSLVEKKIDLEDEVVVLGWIRSSY